MTTDDLNEALPAVEEAVEKVEKAARDAANWAPATSSFTVGEVPAGAININVSGRKQVNPIHGFGRMWQKTYSVALEGAAVTPQEVIAAWKANFDEFWPGKNRFFGPLTGIAPGDVALLNLALPGGLKLSTGVLVLYADEESFTLMTPQGHMFAGWITFSAFEKEDHTIARAQVLIRSNDPIYELGFMLGGGRKEDVFWKDTLSAVAAHFGVEGDVEIETICVDKRRQWRNAVNIRHNSAIRSALYMMGTPARAVAKPFRRKPIVIEPVEEPAGMRPEDAQ